MRRLSLLAILAALATLTAAFGAGVCVPLSGHLVFETGIRVHGWSVDPFPSGRGGSANPDGLIALQSGVTVGF